jgi:RNA polymerase sigma-70 factor (ECF subfamily)
MPSRSPSTDLLAAIERGRRRVWALCYRMTGTRAAADDLAQESIARAIEHEPDDTSALDGWLLRVATTTCLDHLRRERRVRRVTDLVDPIALPELPAAAALEPESAAILREDVRFALVVALQVLPPRQRAALVLHDVCDRSLAEVAATLGTNTNAAKATVHRARAALVAARGRTDVDVVADATVVERLARAIEARSVEAVSDLLAADVWGVVDGGATVRVATRPTVGRRAVSRRWANTERRLAGIPIACAVRRLNGEPALVITAGGVPFASVHVETRGGLVAALRVVRAPERLAAMEAA